MGSNLLATKVPVSVTLDPERLARLDDAARRWGTSRSHIVRMLIDRIDRCLPESDGEEASTTSIRPA